LLLTVCGIALLALVAGATAYIVLGSSSPGDATLLVSPNPDRSDAVDLTNRTLSGRVAIFLSDERPIRQVAFYLDDPEHKGPPTRREVQTPYDFHGRRSDGQANLFDTTRLADGSHAISAEILLADGSVRTVERTAVVANAAASAAPTVPATAVPTAGPSVTATPTTPPPVVLAGAAGPSGLAMPRGDLADWKQVFADDFEGTSLAKGWGAYNGDISSTPGGLWKPSHVRVQNGLLRLLGYQEANRWVTGGLMNTGAATTSYGKYEVRFRADNGNGVKYAILLWPDTNVWPDDGEIDFAEDDGGVRDGFSATVHYVSGGSHQTIQRQLKGDFSVWHTVGVEWSPSGLVYTLDGKAWATVSTTHTPSVAMNLVIQTEAATTCSEFMTCVDASTPSTVAVEVDWVTAYVRR
jgi:hypothetical protein